MRHKIWALLALMLLGCTGKPDAIEPVQPFDVTRYLGKWYEIARLDHRFERGLVNVTADYSLREDGGIQVINRGYDPAKQRWDQAEGKAYFIDETDKGYLKVSFFGPFYGSYVIFELDPDYRHAYISGPNHDYLWLLSRTPQVPAAVVQDFIDKANAAGFDTESLILVEQRHNDNSD